MAGQRGTRTTRSRQDSTSWPVGAAASAVASGSAAGTSPRRRTAPRAKASLAPQLPTRSTYRNLLMRGLTPDEAANLTAFMSGIHVGDKGWKLKQVNQLLFLRELQRSGRFGASDGEVAVQ